MYSNLQNVDSKIYDFFSARGLPPIIPSLAYGLDNTLYAGTFYRLLTGKRAARETHRLVAVSVST